MENDKEKAELFLQNTADIVNADDALIIRRKEVEELISQI